MAEQDKKMQPCPKLVRGQQELTPEQDAYARHFAQEREAIMLSTTAIDEAEAEMHLRQVYDIAGLKPPQVYWLDSPMAFLLAFTPPKTWEGLSSEQYSWLSGGEWKKMRARLGASVDNRVWTTLEDSLGASQEDLRDWEQLWSSSMWPGTWASLEDGIQDALEEHVKTRVGESVCADLQHGVAEIVGEGVWDSMLAYYREHLLAFYHFLHEAFEPNSFIHLARFNELVSGYSLRRTKTWLVRKPTLLQRDEQGRFHSDKGMCLRYRDGWGFYAWHGVRTSEKLILHPEHFTKEDWLREHNPEVRRAVQERIGNDRFVELVGGTRIDQGTQGELIAVDLGNDPEEVAHYIHVRDASTQRLYYRRVPPSIKRADEAVAWTSGVDEQDYQPAMLKAQGTARLFP